MISLVHYDFLSHCTICTLPILHSTGSVQPTKTESSYGIGSFNLLLLFVIMSGCFTTVSLIQIKNTVFSYVIQACEAVSDVFLALPLLACVAFRCVDVCSSVKWTHLLSHEHSLIQYLPPPGPKKPLSTWQNCSLPGSLYQCTGTVQLALAERKEHGQLQRSCPHHASLHYTGH